MISFEKMKILIGILIEKLMFIDDLKVSGT